MQPSTAPDDFLDIGPRDTEQNSKFTFRHASLVMQTTYFTYLIGGKFRRSIVYRMAFLETPSFWRRGMMPATFLNSVAYIIGRCPDEEMIGADARGVVTVVTYVQPLGDRAISNLPRQAMCLIKAVLYVECAVPPLVSMSDPHPTLTRRIDLRPEPVDVSLSDSVRSHLNTPVASQEARSASKRRKLTGRSRWRSGLLVRLISRLGLLAGLWYNTTTELFTLAWPCHGRLQRRVAYCFLRTV